MRHKLLVLLMLALCTGVLARSPELRKVGDTVDARIESPHPVSGFWRQDVDVAGASFLKLHLADLQLGDGDLLLITDAYGQEVYSATGPSVQQGWLPSVEGDHLTLEIWPVKGSTARGITVDKVGQGFATPTPESICGVDDSRDAACYQSDSGKWTAGDAVGRMLFQMSDGGWYLCTGSLVSSQSHFLTNNHCIENEHAANTLEVKWRYQYSACSGGTLGTASTSTGAHLLVTNANLDFSLVQFTSDTPAQRYGYLSINPVLPSVGDVLWIPQHPGGYPKRFAVVSDLEGGGNAKVQALNLDGVQTGGHTDLGYFADTQGGSSGSPVLGADNRIVALHHFGIGSGSCNGSNMNQGVEIVKILPYISGYLSVPPVITTVTKVTNPPPLKLKIAGSNFHQGCVVQINGQAVPQTQYVSSTLVKAKGGTALKAMIPKGVPVVVTVVNTDQSLTSNGFTFTR